MNNFSAISWLEQCYVRRDDNDVHFVVDQQA